MLLKRNVHSIQMIFKTMITSHIKNSKHSNTGNVSEIDPGLNENLSLPAPFSAPKNVDYNERKPKLTCNRREMFKMKKRKIV